MTRPISEEFGGEPRAFKCALGELKLIQAKCGSPSMLAFRLARGVAVRREFAESSVLDQAAIGLGDWLIDDVREPIFQGLIGGGMAPNDAGKLCRTWIDDRGFKGLVENLELALAIVLVGLEDPEPEPAGEPGADAAPPAKTPPTTEP